MIEVKKKRKKNFFYGVALALVFGRCRLVSVIGASALAGDPVFATLFRGGVRGTLLSYRSNEILGRSSLMGIFGGLIVTEV